MKRGKAGAKGKLSEHQRGSVVHRGLTLPSPVLAISKPHPDYFLTQLLNPVTTVSPDEKAKAETGQVVCQTA